MKRYQLFLAILFVLLLSSCTTESPEIKKEISTENCKPPTNSGKVEFVEDRGNYLIFNGDEIMDAKQPWLKWQDAQANAKKIIDPLLQIHDDDSTILIFLGVNGNCCTGRVFTSNVQGIGAENDKKLMQKLGKPTVYWPDLWPFDLTPESTIESFQFYGNWKNFFGPGMYKGVKLSDPGLSRVRLILGHEMGHRWTAHAHYIDANGEEKTDLLGGEGNHWSLYMDSEDSPLEGLNWEENPDGTFSAKTKNPPYRFAYNDIDLYFMGLLDAREVKPWFLIENPYNCLLNGQPGECPRHTPYANYVNKGEVRTLTVSGTKKVITVEDIIAAEGPRVPAYKNAPKNMNVIFILLKRANEQVTEQDKQQIEELVNLFPQAWKDLTRGRGTLAIKSKSYCPLQSTKIKD